MKRNTLASQREDIKWSDKAPSGEMSANYQGGKYIDDKGYVRVLRTDHPKNIRGYAYEHRLVMEQYLNRYLEFWETVHHINEIKTDNRLENLFLCSHSEHSAIHKEGRRISNEHKSKMRDVVKTTKPHSKKKNSTVKIDMKNRFKRHDH